MGFLDGARVFEEEELNPPPKPIVIPVTRCACQDCKDRTDNPKGYWDRLVARIVEETA